MVSPRWFHVRSRLSRSLRQESGNAKTEGQQQANAAPQLAPCVAATSAEQAVPPPAEQAVPPPAPRVDQQADLPYDRRTMHDVPRKCSSSHRQRGHLRRPSKSSSPSESSASSDPRVHVNLGPVLAAGSATRLRVAPQRPGTPTEAKAISLPKVTLPSTPSSPPPSSAQTSSLQLPHDLSHATAAAVRPANLAEPHSVRTSMMGHDSRALCATWQHAAQPEPGRSQRPAGAPARGSLPSRKDEADEANANGEAAEGSHKILPRDHTLLLRDEDNDDEEDELELSADETDHDHDDDEDKEDEEVATAGLLVQEAQRLEALRRAKQTQLALRWLHGRRKRIKRLQQVEDQLVAATPATPPRSPTHEAAQSRRQLGKLRRPTKSSSEDEVIAAAAPSVSEAFECGLRV